MGLSREEEEETECGAVCGRYQGFQNTAEEIITARDGAITFGVLAELLIDLYEFSGTGINIRGQLTSNAAPIRLVDILAALPRVSRHKHAKLKAFR